MIVFWSLFFTGPYIHGFVKNFLGITKNKTSYIVSTYLVGCLYIAATFVLGALILTLASPHINDGMFTFTSYPRLFRILAVELLSHLSYLAFILLIATVTKSTSLTLMVTFLYPTILFNFIGGIAQKLLGVFFKLNEDFAIADYVNIGNIISKTFASSNADLARAAIVALVIGALCLIGSSIIINKKDI